MSVCKHFEPQAWLLQRCTCKLRSMMSCACRWSRSSIMWSFSHRHVGNSREERSEALQRLQCEEHPCLLRVFKRSAVAYAFVSWYSAKAMSSAGPTAWELEISDMAGQVVAAVFTPIEDIAWGEAAVLLVVENNSDCNAGCGLGRIAHQPHVSQELEEKGSKRARANERLISPLEPSYKRQIYSNLMIRLKPQAIQTSPADSNLWNGKARRRHC